jgi:L-aspartate oxidase
LLSELPASLPDLFAARGEGAPVESELRALMQSNVGVIRTGASLAHALGEFAEIERTAASGDLRNMAAAALLIGASAFARTESRGGHFRSDFPKADPAQAVRSYITLNEARAIAARSASKAA